MHFHYDKILESDEICNLSNEKQKILQCIASNKNLVVYGRRNIGKTSVLKNLVIPAIVKKHPNTFIMFADLLGVKTIDQITTRLLAAFRLGFNKSKPKDAFMKKVFESIKHLRPVMTIDPVTGPSFTLGVSNDHTVPRLSQLFREINELSKSVPIVIILDEFQDIHFVEEAAGLLRDCFQNLKKNCSIVVSGSKKHILATMFGRSRAAFSGFGQDLEFQEIPYNEYTTYINERFLKVAKSIDHETSIYLQDLMYRVPEAINILCDEISDSGTKKKIEKNCVLEGLARVLDQRQGRFEETISRFNASESRVLTVIAKSNGIEKPAGKEFVSKCELSPRGVKKILDKLMNTAEVYRWQGKYILAEPLLHHYLRHYR